MTIYKDLKIGSSVNGTSQRYTYNITSSVNSVSGADANGNTLAYDSGFADVYLNGVRLSGTDITITSGNSVSFASNLSNGDVVDIVAYGAFTVASVNADNLSSGTVPDARITGAYTGITNLTMTGNLTVDTNTLFVDSSNNRVGVSTTSPSKTLTVAGDMNVQKSGDNMKADFSNGVNANFRILTAGSVAQIGPSTASDVAFLSGNAEKMRLTSAGKFLVNTTGEYAGTGAEMTVNDGIDVGTTSSANGGFVSFVGDGVGQIGEIGSKVNGYSTMPNIEFHADNVSGGSQAGHIEFNTKFSGGSRSEAVRIDSSGNLFVGTTTEASDDVGHALLANGAAYHTTDGTYAGLFNRKSSDGQIIQIRRNNTLVGSLDTTGVSSSGRLVVKSTTFDGFLDRAGTTIAKWMSSSFTGGSPDTFDLGRVSERWRAIYLSDSIDLSKSANQAQVNIRSTTIPNGSKTGGQINLSLGTGSNSGSGNTSTQFGDILGNINFNGQGTDFSFQGGGIEVKQTTPLGQTNRTDAGCDMIFKVISAGGTGYTEKLRIKSSGGITFNGDTSIHNALDDYEEGTFTPSLSIASSAAAGFYTKIGNIVHAYFKITTGATGNNISLNNLPFVTKGSNPDVVGGARETNTSGRFYQIAASQSNTSAFIFRYDNSNSISSGMIFQGSLIYQTN